MDLPRNAFKHAIARGETQIGLWSGLCSNVVAEIIGDRGNEVLEPRLPTVGSEVGQAGASSCSRNS